VKAILLVINSYHRRTIYSNVLRDEEVQFPPQADHTYNPESDPVLAGLNISELLQALENGMAAKPELAAFLKLSHSLVVLTFWALDTKKFQEL